MPKLKTRLKPKNLYFKSYEEFLNAKKKKKYHPAKEIIKLIEMPEPLVEVEAKLKNLDGEPSNDGIKEVFFDFLQSDMLTKKKLKKEEIYPYFNNHVQGKDLIKYPNYTFEYVRLGTKFALILISDDTKDGQNVGWMNIMFNKPIALVVLPKHRGQQLCAEMYKFALDLEPNFTHDIKLISLPTAKIIAKMYFNSTPEEIIRINKERKKTN